MPTYKTPNVYVEEVSTLPPSVAPVATAVPAFIGYTEKAGSDNEYRNKPVRISSMLDYTTIFGGAQPTEFTVTLDGKGQQISKIERKTGKLEDPPKYLMYYALRLFFQNEGGSCYVVSIGDYSGLKKDDFQKDGELKGLDAISTEDEPTLIMLPDAVSLPAADYYTLCQSALAQCNKLKDRFAIFDVLASDRDTKGIGAGFRAGIGTENLKYGAAYYPYLQTSLSHYYTDASVTMGLHRVEAVASDPVGRYSTGDDGLLITYAGPESENPRVRITVTELTDIAVEESSNVLNIQLPKAGASVSDILAKANALSKYKLARNGAGTATITALPETRLAYPPAPPPSKDSLASIKTSKTELYNAIKTALDGVRVVMPPSAAVAGVYAKVDRERGVWKAPANIGFAAVIAPTVKITNDEQENLNVDSTSGKSINAIRSFTGKGTLIWGARTLAGNDNEWRYISVRRLFNLIEESIQKATSFVVFESNNAITWLKVRTVIETYLEGLWRQGAMAGATQKEAYFVSVGLGQTMTEQDILEGRMIIKIGISAVRPAEFIVLRFSHKLQQA